MGSGDCHGRGPHRKLFPLGWSKTSHSLEAPEEDGGWSSAEELINSSDAEEDGGVGSKKLVTLASLWVGGSGWPLCSLNKSTLAWVLLSATVPHPERHNAHLDQNPLPIVLWTCVPACLELTHGSPLLKGASHTSHWSEHSNQAFLKLVHPPSTRSLSSLSQKFHQNLHKWQGPSTALALPCWPGKPALMRELAGA